MITYSNIHRSQNTPFDKYLEIPGLSHSSLKNIKDGIYKEFVPSDKIKIGKIVDDIRMFGETDISNPLYPIAKNIAECLRIEIGENILKSLISQVSYVADMKDELGLGIRIKGRPDWELGRLAVVDLKVTFTGGIKKKEDLIPLINFMGYDNQLWNYGKLGDKKHHYLFIYSTYAKKTFFFKRLVNEIDKDIAENWWANKILEHGQI